MWTGPYRVAFEPPAGFRDWTHYSFTEPAQRELVKVGYGSVPNSAETARDVLMQRRGELATLKDYDPELAVDPVTDVTAGTLPAAMLSFTGHEGHYEFREWWVIALL